MSQGLYIHIPFCIKKCNYCDFLSFPAGSETIARYCTSLEEEIAHTADALEVEEKQVPFTSIFLGGGTPSILCADQIFTLFTCIRKHFLIKDSAEISIEANPGTMTREKLKAWKEVGINRLSIGLQSTDHEMLKRLGRIHSFPQFVENYEMARSSGFDNINIDLISGLPGQTMDSWAKTLNTVVTLKPEHISAYSLIIEEGTPFALDASILDNLPDEETDREIYDYTKRKLSDHGYHRYEISNYALEGKECRHNIGYWDGSPYLGLGLGASSYYRHARFSNEANLRNYLETPFVPFHKRADYQKQTKEQEIEDRMIFGLRMMQGVSKIQFQNDFGVSLESIYGDVIEKHKSYGLLQESKGRIQLTDKGIDISNLIFQDFLQLSL